MTRGTGLVGDFSLSRYTPTAEKQVTDQESLGSSSSIREAWPEKETFSTLKILCVESVPWVDFTPDGNFQKSQLKPIT